MCVCVCVWGGGGGGKGRVEGHVHVCVNRVVNILRNALYLCSLDSLYHGFLQPLYKMGLFKVTLKLLHINLEEQGRGGGEMEERWRGGDKDKEDNAWKQAVLHTW